MKLPLQLGLGSAFLAATMTLGAGAADAKTLRIEFTNNASADGLFFTPFLGLFHDGSVNTFDVGQAASLALEDVAEEGFVGQQIAAAEALGAKAGVAFGPEGFGSGVRQPPVIDPGETASFEIDLDPTSDIFFSFLSMIIPSNDIFIGNSDPFAFRLFDDEGNFILTSPISIGLDNTFDAGTEDNLATATDGAGAAFTPGFEVGGGTATENGVVSEVGNLDFLFGLGRASGGTVGSLPGAGQAFASLRITEVAPVPLPAGVFMLMAGLGAMGAVGARRRRTREI